MGVDAMLFAVKAKKYYNVDRAYNLKPHGYAGDHGDILKKMDNQTQISFQDMEQILTRNIEYYLQPDEEGERSEFGRAIRNVWAMEFIKMFPDDTFIFATDSGHPSDHDIKEQGGYTEIDEKELYEKVKPVERTMVLLYDISDDDDE